VPNEWLSVGVTIFTDFDPFPRLVFPTAASFFAGKELASTNTSSHSRMHSWSNSDRKAHHISLRTWVSFYSLRRRQQVEAFGHQFGRSVHLAAVLSIESTPSKANRSSTGDRTLFRPIGFFGMKCSILRHCSSVNCTGRLLTGLTSREMHIPKNR
jgi:hypothetical protein